MRRTLATIPKITSGLLTARPTNVMSFKSYLRPETLGLYSQTQSQGIFVGNRRAFCEKKPETPETETPETPETEAEEKKPEPQPENPPKEKKPDIDPEFSKERLTKETLINLVHKFSKSESKPHYHRLLEEIDHFYEVKSQRSKMNERLGMMEAINDSNKVKLESFVEAIKEAETEQTRIHKRLT